MYNIYNQNTTFELEQTLQSAHSELSKSELCEQLSLIFCSAFLRDYKNNHSRIIVFAGPGFNGALALSISRILISRNIDVRHVILLNPTGRLTDECSIALSQLREVKSDVKEVTQSFNPPIINDSDIIIDGICGVEITVPFAGDLANIARYINTKSKNTVSIDIPSGLMAEDNSNNNLEYVIQAKKTYTFHGPKLAFMFKDNAKYVGEWHVLNNGLDSKFKSDIEYFLFTSSDADGYIQERKRHTNKYDYGRVALIAGSRGMQGAAILAGRAAMKSGVGLLSIHSYKGGETAIHAALPEALVTIDNSSEGFTMFSSPQSYDAIAIGPGLGKSFEAAAALEGLMRQYDKPMVIDADAINLIASNSSLLDLIPKKSILTPHTAEFDRLVSGATSDYDRLMKASKLAVDRNIIIVLKGAYTATCLYNGKIIFNSSGNPGMATAGAGDVLTGTILGFLGKGIKPHLAAVMAVYFTGYAGDIYVQDYSQESLMATDIINNMARVFKIYKP